jgi:exosome complex RNA-binding protein Rrp42 (RNase PH superfamily)
MAIREEHDFLSENERKFLFDCIQNKPYIRADGRELMQQRKVC